MTALAHNPVGFLGPRWRPLCLHEKQRAYWRSTARFNVAPCGRRTGKTELAKRKTVKRAMRRVGRYLLGAPVHHQAKSIFWDDLKALSKPFRRERASESELTVRLLNGSEIVVAGLDKPERVEGPPLHGAVLDEYGNMRADVWPAHVRPMLAETNGWCDFIGVPEGRNHYYDLWCNARACDDGEWGAHTWTMEEVLPLYLGPEAAEAEIAAMAAELDELTFEQETRASFVQFTGRVYYAFGDDNVEPGLREQVYRPDDDLYLCFDFNVEPGVCAILQEAGGDTCVIGEVFVPRNSNTETVCRKIREDWLDPETCVTSACPHPGPHRGRLLCYGDPSGGARRTSAAVGATDWGVVREVLPGCQVRRDEADPGQRPRINALNRRIRSASGDRRLFVDRRCRWTVRDLEGVAYKEGTSEIDKAKDPRLTHLSDGLAYYCCRAHPALMGERATSAEV